MNIEIHLPRAYFAAGVFFAWRMAQLANLSLLDAIGQYTGLYREVTGRQGLEGEVDPVWLEVAAQVAVLDEPEEITDLLYATYLAQPHSRYVPGMNLLGATVFGALGTVYDGTLHQARMHYFGRRSSVSALASAQVAARREDFRRLLHDLAARHPDALTIKSSTWLHNLPNYRNLFPAAFQARLKNIGGSTYLGIWGQFAKADGSGNAARLAEFRTRLLAAQSVDEAIDAFPFKVFEAVGPVTEFYAAYQVETATGQDHG